MPKTMTKKNNMTALVTGGAGFIGSHLVDRLIAEGFSVAVVDHLANGRRDYLNPKAHFYKINVTDRKLGVVFAAEKPAVVFHLAAQIDARASIQDPIRDAETNIHGSLRVLEQSVRHGVKKFVFFSSGGAIYHGATQFPIAEKVAPSPLTPYGVAKLSFEYYLEVARYQHGLSYVALRPANVYGPRQDQKGEGGVIGVFCRLLAEGKTPKIFGDGRQTRDFVYVEDVVDAALQAISLRASGTYHISTGKETQIRTAAALIAKAFAWRGAFGRGPVSPGDVRRSVLDPRLARKKLGWSAKTPLEDGIKKTVAWFKGR